MPRLVFVKTKVAHIFFSFHDVEVSHCELKNGDDVEYGVVFQVCAGERNTKFAADFGSDEWGCMEFYRAAKKLLENSNEKKKVMIDMDKKEAYLEDLCV